MLIGFLRLVWKFLQFFIKIVNLLKNAPHKCSIHHKDCGQIVEKISKVFIKIVGFNKFNKKCQKIDSFFIKTVDFDKFWTRVFNFF